MENSVEKKESWLTPCDASPINVDIPVCTVDECSQPTDAAQVTQNELLSKIAAGFEKLNEEIENIRRIEQMRLLLSMDIEELRAMVGEPEFPVWQWEMLLDLMKRLGLPSPSDDAEATSNAENEQYLLWKNNGLYFNLPDRKEDFWLYMGEVLGWIRFSLGTNRTKRYHEGIFEPVEILPAQNPAPSPLISEPHFMVLQSLKFPNFTPASIACAIECLSQSE